MDTVTRLADIVRHAPDSTLDDGRYWYERAHIQACHLSETLGVDPWPGCAILAALSPQLDAETNLSDDVLAIVRGERRRTPERQLQKVRALLAGADVDDVLVPRTSPKTSSFAHNLYDPCDDAYVTIDGRIADLVDDVMRPWEARRGLDRLPVRTPGKYRETCDVIRETARVLRRSRQFGWANGVNVQAVLWCEAKRWELHGTTCRGLPRKQGPARTGQSYTSLRESVRD